MDYKEIVSKALAGENVTELVKEFTPEQKVEYNRELVNASDEAARLALEKKTAIQKELDRKAAQHAEPTAELSAFRSEQLQKAKNKLYSNPDYPLTDAQKTLLEQSFPKYDSGKMDADNIYEDLTTAYAVINKNQLIADGKKIQEFSKNASGFNATGANQQGGSINPDAAKFSPQAQDIWNAWQRDGIVGKNYSLEAAERIAKNGFSKDI